LTDADGVLLVDKPSGLTSHDVVDRIRRRFGFHKVGHGGTLDPLATGLLVILIGRGTRASGWFLASDKSYEGTMRLGISTDSQDAQGKTTREADPSGVTREPLEAEMRKLTGDIRQIPPMVSAMKVDGVPLYKRARRGQVVERKPKLVHVYAFDLLGFAPPRATFRLRCTKGTYVRTLCSDVGDALGCGAHLEQLRRTRSGDFDLSDALPLDDLLAMRREDFIGRMIPLHALALAAAAGPRLP
jgi:tRNA pseudouridine55 synthase